MPYRLPATVVDFQEASSPWLAGPPGWGRAPRRQGCPHLLQARSRAAQGGGLFPPRCLGQQTQRPLCALPRVWAERSSLLAGVQGRCGLPSSLDPSPPQPGERRTSEGTGGRLFFGPVPSHGGLAP